MISSSGKSSSWMLSISEKTLKYGLLTTGLALFVLVIFLTDYFSLNIDQWKLQSLKKENQELQTKFYSVHSQLRDLETEIRQLSDFTNKLKLITTASVHGNNNNMGYGKVSQSALLALSKFSGDRKLASLNERLSNSESAVIKANHVTHTPPARIYQDNQALELHIASLKNKSQLIQQDAWTLYTDLSDQKNFINNTPSITPVKDCWISSTYGYRNEIGFVDHQPDFHKGLDLACRMGAPVMSTADGKVVYSGYDEFGYGNVVVIDHGYNLRTYYAHLSEITTKVGSFVSKGDVIAAVGNTGKSTGPHLHYEIRIFGSPVNPENYTLDTPDYFRGTSL